MASYIVTGIHAAARAGKYGKVREGVGCVELLSFLINSWSI